MLKFSLIVLWCCGQCVLHAACLNKNQLQKRLVDIAMLCATPDEKRLSALLKNPIVSDIKIAVPPGAERVVPILRRRWLTVDDDLKELIMAYENTSTSLLQQIFEKKLRDFRKNLVFIWSFRLWQKFNPVGHATTLQGMTQEELGGCVAQKITGFQAYKKAHDFALGMIEVFDASGYDINGFLAVARACQAFWRRETQKGGLLTKRRNYITLS